MPSVPFVLPQPLNIAAATGLSASGFSNPISLPPRSADMSATFHFKFTLGSLTNVTFSIQALNPDGITWGSVITGGATALGTGVLTASGNYAISALLPGCKSLRVAYVTTGALTGSAVVIDCTVRQ